ncbi:hypothetical protein V6N12_031608 [Hibiscus sabdariffa]|uniref:Uncharacterized protein n=1 Tax=Hibiscus sabdariffa TaxID=183260 RepID=A0ABR2DV06_9ROSI
MKEGRGNIFIDSITENRDKESSVDGSTTSNRMGYGEVIDPTINGEEDCPALQSGVPPYELERRLHELLEQQIRELEIS